MTNTRKSKRRPSERDIDNWREALRISEEARGEAVDNNAALRRQVERLTAENRDLVYGGPPPTVQRLRKAEAQVEQLREALQKIADYSPRGVYGNDARYRLQAYARTVLAADQPLPRAPEHPI